MFGLPFGGDSGLQRIQNFLVVKIVPLASRCCPDTGQAPPASFWVAIGALTEASRSSKNTARSWPNVLL